MSALYRSLFLTVILVSLSLPALAQGRGSGQRGPASVFADTVEARTFAARVEAIGTLEPKERVELSVNAADRVTALYFDDGQRVRAGQTLLSLAQREQIALVEAAEAQVAEASSTLDRRKRLLEEDAISESAYEEAQRDYQSAQANLRAVQSRLKDRILVAPFDGVLGFRRVSVGAYLSPGMPVATLIDDSEMRLEFSVPSIFLSQVSQGTQVKATTDDLPGLEFAGSVTSIDNAIDPVTRSFRVRATIPNTDRMLRAGMFMMVDLYANPRQGLAIPEGAVQAEGPRNYVYALEQRNGQLVSARREVTLGRRERGVVEVLAGLSEGERVVTDGLISVRDGAPVVVRDPAILEPTAGPGTSGASTLAAD